MMEIKILTKNDYALWDKFCLGSDDAWFWHTTKWLDYCVLYGLEKFGTKNVSFYLSDDSGVLAVVPLLLEQKNGQYEFSTAGSGGYGIAPALRRDLAEDRREKVCKEVFAHIDSLAEQYKVVKASLRMTALSSSADTYNWLLKYGYLDASINTQVIDLSAPLDKIKSAVRKGHKYDINRGEKHYVCHVFDQKQPDFQSFEQYRLLHHKAAGRVTRPVETFQMMYDWILSGEGMLCGVSRDGKFAGFSYVSLYKGKAYYSSASDDPEFETNVPISHVIQWSIIRWLKENGFKTYEIGVQQFGPLLHDIPSAKDLSISFFKRGFGGATVPLYRGVKYYDREFMRKEMTAGLEALLAAGEKT